MVLYKTFRTAKNYYLYDTSTNKVVNLYKKAYNYINNAKKGNEFKLEEKSIKGSFDIVFEKLMRIKKEYPDYYLTHINVSAVLPSMKAFERVAPFFEELGLEVFFSDMVHGSTYPIDEYINFINKKRTDYSFDEIKSIYFENLSNNCICQYKNVEKFRNKNVGKSIKDAIRH